MSPLVFLLSLRTYCHCYCGLTISCPQCGAAYRVPEDMLDEKIECSECHRVFFAKSTAGKRVAAPDHTKAYIGFGVVIVAIIGLFAISGSGNSAPPKKKKRPLSLLFCSCT